MESPEQQDIERQWLYGARNGDTTTVQAFLRDTDAGSISLDINCKGRSKANLGWSALHLAAYFGHQDVVSALLQAGAVADIQNDSGDTPLHRAAFTGRTDVVMQLLRSGADVSIINAEGHTPKSMAKGEDVKSMIEAAENYENKRAEDELQRMAREGDVDGITGMLKSRNPPNINCCDTFGNTALHCAAYRGQKEVAILLLQNGVDTQAKNAKGQTALDLASTTRMKQLLDVKPVKQLQRDVQRFEGPLLRKRGVLGWRQAWVVLNRGVLSMFQNRADATTGARRKSFKYLDNAKVQCPKDSGHIFKVSFSDGSVSTFSVEIDTTAQLNRQKWENALMDHIAFSSYFLQGADVSDDDVEDIVPLGSMQDVLQNCNAHQQLLDKQVSTVTSSISTFGTNRNTAHQEVNILQIRTQLSQIVETARDMASSLSHCLTLVTQQEEVRKLQVQQEAEKSRVLQDALRILAQEHHSLEQSLGPGHRSPSVMFDSDDEEEFHDCEDTAPPPRMPNLHSTPNGSALMRNKFEDVPMTCRFRDEWGARSRLPAPMFSRNDFSVWSILKQCIGKELSKITMPVIFNEPLSFLQRVVEYMEYAELLRRACDCEDPILRLEYVTAFAVSATASNWERIGKPFNPLLGETYELEREDLGFRIVCEQVSHHPPMSAFHVSSPSYTFHGSIHPKLKFWGKSVEVTPKGIVTLHLLRHNEVYTWQNVNCCVHNIIVGKLWIEHYGSMEITNHTLGLKASLTFKPSGWFGKDLHKVEGYITDSGKRKLRAFYGKWIEALYSYEVPVWENYVKMVSKEKEAHFPAIPRPGSSRDSEEPPPRGSSCDLQLPGQRLLWIASPRPPDSVKYYSFTLFALMLNELEEGRIDSLPPTDCRLRPDMRSMEQGDIDAAATEKNRLEEKQRAARKDRKKRKEEWKPRWFRQGVNPHTGKDDWLFQSEYWQRNWARSPDIF